MSNLNGSANTALREVRLADRNVTISGLSDYCIDKTLLRPNVAALFPCANLGMRRAEWPQTRAAFVVTVGQPGGADLLVNPDDTQAFLKSNRGRQVLSRTGNAATVTVARTVARRDAIYVLASDTSPNPFGQNQLRHWRAFTMLNGRLTTVSATGYGEVSLAEDQGFAMLERFVKRLRSDNGAVSEIVVTRSGKAAALAGYAP